MIRQTLKDAWETTRNLFGMDIKDTNWRVAGVPEIHEGAIQINRPIQVIYKLRIDPDTSGETRVKLLSRGENFGMIAAPVSGYGYTEEDCSHVTQIGTFPRDAAEKMFADFENGEQIDRIFGATKCDRDALLSHLAAFEQRNDVTARTRPLDVCCHELRSLGYR
jgi:hypothetical protein